MSVLPGTNPAHDLTIRDRAECGRLADAVTTILPALEEFLRFTGRDDSGRNRSAWTTRLDQPLPATGAGLEPVLRDLVEAAIPNGVRIGAPGFSGWVTTGATTSAVAARLAATVAGNQRNWTHAFHGLERIGLRWLRELLSVPADFDGLFVSGGAVANLVALGGARQAAFERRGIDPARHGLPRDSIARIYAGSEIHHVVMRAAGVLGLGRASVHAVAVDHRFRVDVSAMRRQLERDRADGIVPIALVASAGTVNTGAVDPIAELAELAAEFDTWLHVDGAYGFPGRLDPAVAELFEGADRADSIAVDPHKWLAVPVGCGAVFVRDRAQLARAFTLEPAEYLDAAPASGDVESTFDDFGVQYFHFGVEQSAPSRGVLVWAVLREIGVEGVRERIVRHNAFARRIAELVRADARLELLAEPVLSICCFRYRGAAANTSEEQCNDMNAAIVRRLWAETDLVPSGTFLHGRFAIRPCFINPRTTLREVEALPRLVRQFGDELAAGSHPSRMS